MTLPFALVLSGQLTDSDVRLLLLLDLIRWRDGEITQSNVELGEMLGKSGKAVLASLRRLETSSPPLVARQMARQGVRGSIEILYDRLGRDEDPVGFTDATPTRFRVDPPPENGWTPHPKMGGPPTQKWVDPPPENGWTPHPIPGGPPTRKWVDPPPKNGGGPPIRVLESQTPPEPTPIGDVVYTALTSINTGTEDHETPDVGGWSGESTPKTIIELVDFLNDIPTGDSFKDLVASWVRLVRIKVPAHADAAIDWVIDAVMAADAIADKDSKGGPPAYALACLNKWISLGGRPKVEIAQAEAKATEEANRPAEAKAAEEKARAAEAAKESAGVDAARKARWDRLPVRKRDEIESAVGDAYPGLRRWTNLMIPHYLDEMDRRYPTVAPRNESAHQFAVH